MASLYWSWIFIILFFQPGRAQVSYKFEVLAKRALENAVFNQELSKTEKSRNTFIGLAIAGGVVFLALVAGLIILIMRNKKKVEEPESQPTESQPTESVDKARWFMVDNDKVNWWNNFRWQSSPDNEHPDGSRIERIKAALKKSKKEKPLLPLVKAQPNLRDSIDLPIQSDPELHSSDILERAYKAPIYPATPQVPTVTRTMYEGDKPQPRSPPRAIVTAGLTRSHMRPDRRGFPRSPAGRRKSWLTRGGHLRNPFVPLKDSDAMASAPKSAFVDSSKPSYTLPVNLRVGESKLIPPPLPKHTPPPLNLDSDSRREVRVGLPTSPRPRVRIQSPAFCPI